MTLEFELPLASFFFIALLLIVYISKKKVSIIENKLYNVILGASTLSILCDTILHFNGSMHTYEEIVEMARKYINEIGGFEEFAKWGLY